jgi:hypothetical protein
VPPPSLAPSLHSYTAGRSDRAYTDGLNAHNAEMQAPEGRKAALADVDIMMSCKHHDATWNGVRAGGAGPNAD